MQHCHKSILTDSFKVLYTWNLFVLRILGLQPCKTGPFPIKTRGFRAPGTPNIPGTHSARSKEIMVDDHPLERMETS